jgi:Arc/MetJ family transcription regulator
MKTNIVIDDEIMKKAKRLASLKTKRDVVDLALRELINNLKKKKLSLFRRKGLWEGNLGEMRRKRFDAH